MTRLVAVSNRVNLDAPADRVTGGLAVALNDILAAANGVWFGWSGEVKETGGPPARVSQQRGITYAVIDLKPADYQAYYSGFSNNVLWPLLHFRLGLIEFDRVEFEGYVRVNRLFAESLMPLLRPGDAIWVHDYHLIPLGAELRSLGFRGRIGFFLHTPLPPPAVLKALPVHRALFEAFGAYDLVGFQTAEGVTDFCDYLRTLTDAKIRPDGEIYAFGRRFRAGVFPVGIDGKAFAENARRSAQSSQTRRLTESLVERRLIVGADRLDYSKGLSLRFRAFHHLLVNHRAWRRHVTYLQIAAPSRIDVAQYRQIRRELELEAGRMNGRFAEFDWIPLRYLNKSYSRSTLAGFFHASHVGFVTPLRDGMNLVAKEYVAAQNPEDPGVLVLSAFAGAADQLGNGALVVNPFDIEGVAEALHYGLTMPFEERRERWHAMMKDIIARDVNWWSRSFVAALTKS